MKWASPFMGMVTVVMVLTVIVYYYRQQNEIDDQQNEIDDQQNDNISVYVLNPIYLARRGTISDEQAGEFISVGAV